MRMMIDLCTYLFRLSVMPNSTELQNRRRAAIRNLLSAGPIVNQQTLVDALSTQGFSVTQSSISRDLREIGAVKTSLGYELAGSSDGAEDEIAKVASLLRELRSAGPNLLVIKTAIGAAQRVALALDRCGWPEIVGNVGGDDTVFTATSGASAQRSLVSRIELSSNQPL